MEDKAKNKTSLGELFQELDNAFIASSYGEIYKIFIESIEKTLIEKVLGQTFGNQLKAAKILGINRNTLRTKINKFGIKPEKWKI